MIEFIRIQGIKEGYMWGGGKGQKEFDTLCKGKRLKDVMKEEEKDGDFDGDATIIEASFRSHSYHLNRVTIREHWWMQKKGKK